MRQLDQANPSTIRHREEKFTCSYFSVRSDTVQFGAGLPRTYNSIRMKSIGVTIAPIDDEGCTTLVGQYRYVLDLCLLKTPKRRGNLEITALRPYRRRHDPASFCPHFPALFPPS